MAEKPESPYETIIQNLGYHDFNEVPIFEGIYERTVVLKEETKDEKGEKVNAIEAHVFYDLVREEGVYITTAYSINKALNVAKKDYPQEIENNNIVFKIEFLGKTEVKGKPFNQFNIGVCTLQQFDEFTNPKEKAKK